jgi:hypothetical protein
MDTHSLFIENSREHAEKIIGNIRRKMNTRSEERSPAMPVL